MVILKNIFMKETKQIKKCRVCGQPLYKKPLLRYENMPAAAQHLPDKSSLKDDEGVDLAVCQCSGCGLVQLKNKPVPYYREVIRAAAVSPEMLEFRIGQFSNFVKKYSLKRKKIVEIGCGRGEYLSIMSQVGAEAYGLEYSKDSVSQCVKNGLRAQVGFIENEEYKIEGAPFDAFFILSFLEHLPNPGEVLRGISNNLKNNAVGIVEVPNFDMILKKKLFSEFVTDHLMYFTKDTLTTALTLSGFDVIECNEVWHDYIISAIVKKRDVLDVSGFYGNQKKITKEVQEYVNQFQNKRLAVWGAGHQAFAAISLFGIADRIKYIVDSAPFKQGKYSPSTHIPIVSPEKLLSDPVVAVIIMAGSYSDEVAEIIRAKCGRKIKVAIMREEGLKVGE